MVVECECFLRDKNKNHNKINNNNNNIYVITINNNKNNNTEESTTDVVHWAQSYKSFRRLFWRLTLFIDAKKFYKIELCPQA
jgi:hypothetical protein